MYKRKRAGNTITRKINSTKDTAAKADKNHYISNSYLEGFIPIDTEYFTASLEAKKSCPNAENRYESEEKEQKFEEYYSSITEKFTASLQIYLAAILNRYPSVLELGVRLLAADES